jgi:capsular polysaccharide biosynthesis protein
MTTTTFDRRVSSLWDAVSLPSPRNAAISIAVAAFCAMLAGVLSLVGSPTYESRATLSIGQPKALAESSDVGVLDKLDRLRLKYAALADTLPITRPVAARTHESPDAVRDDTTVVVGAESLLMFPTAHASTRTAARESAQVLAEEIVRYADRVQQRAGVPAAEQYDFSIIEPARTAKKISPTTRTAVGAAVFSAIVAVAIAYVALQVVSARRRLN